MAKNNVVIDQATLNQINTGTVIEGKIVTNGNIRIDGDVIGVIESKGKVVIGTTSKIKGDIFCVSADIMGHVDGNIYVTEKASLRGSCVLEGNIQTGQLSIEPGARFNGKCQMGEIMVSDTIEEQAGFKQA